VITDDFFRSELDLLCKRQGLKKKDRNLVINYAMTQPKEDRDTILDTAEIVAREIEAKKKESKRIPTEHSEQVNLIHWFKCTYPGVKIAAIPNGGNRNEREAAALVLEGVSPGVPDIFIPEWLCWVEMKRIKGGVLSKEQEVWRDYIHGIGQHYILAYGFDDAKNKLQSLKALL